MSRAPLPPSPKVHFASRIRVLPSAPYFQSKLGTVAYIGDGGISVAIDGVDIDYVPLDDGEYEVLS